MASSKVPVVHKAPIDNQCYGYSLHIVCTSKRVTLDVWSTVHNTVVQVGFTKECAASLTVHTLLCSAHR